MSVSWKGEVALFVGRRLNKSSKGKDTADVRYVRKGRKEQERSTEESVTGSTGTKQNAREY